MQFSEYFKIHLLSEASIQDKIKNLEYKKNICDSIINNYDYVDYLIKNLQNKDDEITYLEYFYFAIKEFLENNLYYEFYDYKSFVIKYKEHYIEVSRFDELKCRILETADVYIDFENIITKKENYKKHKYLSYLNQLELIKKELPKKLIKDKLENNFK